MASPPRRSVLYNRTRHTSICGDLTNGHHAPISTQASTNHHTGTKRQRLVERKNSLIDSLKGLVVTRTRSTSISSSSGYGSSGNGGSGDLEANGQTDTQFQTDPMDADCFESNMYGTNVEVLAEMEYEYEDDDDGSNADVFLQRSYGSTRRPRRHTCGSRDFVLVRNNSGPSFSVLEVFDCQNNVYSQYLQATSCYDMMPSHAMVVAIDSTVTISKAFTVIMDADACEPRATIWDSERQCHIGVVTLTDMLYLLLNGHETSHSWAQRSLKWLHEERQQLTARLQPKFFVSATPSTSLMDIMEMMIESHVHRVPVFQSEDNCDELLSWVGWKRVLKTVQKQIKTTIKPDWMSKPIGVVRLGTWSDLKTVTLSSTVAHIIELLLQHGLSAVPVVCDRGMLIDVIDKSDIATTLLYLALLQQTSTAAVSGVSGTSKKPTSHLLRPDQQCRLFADVLSRPAQFVIDNRADQRDPNALICSAEADHTLSVIDRLVVAGKKCVAVADAHGQCAAVISIHDILSEVVTRRETQATACECSDQPPTMVVGSERTALHRRVSAMY